MSDQSTPTHKVCPVCGKPARKTFCSSACHAVTRRKGEHRACKACGRNFYVIGGEVKRGHGIFCSLACRFVYRRIHGADYPKRGRKSLHRIVAAEVLGRPLLPGETVHHKDHDKKNFAPDNLEVLPTKAAHHRLHARRGENSEFAKLTWEEVREIRRRRAAGESTRSLATAFNVDISNVRLIVRGKTWRE